MTGKIKNSSLKRRAPKNPAYTTIQSSENPQGKNVHRQNLQHVLQAALEVFQSKNTFTKFMPKPRTLVSERGLHTGKAVITTTTVFSSFATSAR